MDEESSDISAAQLAAVQKKGQFSRSISLALSAKNCEDSVSPAEQDDGTQSVGVTASNGSLSPGPTSRVSPGDKVPADARQLGGIVEDVLLSSEEGMMEESTSSSGDDEYGAAQSALVPRSTASRRRRRTKQQRRRMRRAQREFLAPFVDDDDINRDLSYLDTNEVADRPPRVPTLMELCMRQGLSGRGPFPPGLRPALSRHYAKARLALLQLRWLGRNLALLERQIQWNLIEVSGPHGLKSMQLRRDARSLWRSEWWPYDREPHPERLRWIVPIGCQAYDGAEWKIAALAHYINLTLPRLSSDSGRPPQTEWRCIDRDVQQVKRCLRKRYPKLVQYCFDHAMAYVWWSRGRCSRAQEAFLRIAKQYPADAASETVRSTLWARHRALALMEAGRLLVTSDLPDPAGQLYREAADVAAKHLHPEHVAKLSLQALALMAAAYDQGVMDRHSAVQSSRLWAVATQQALALKPTPPAVLRDFDWRGRGEHLQEKPAHEAVLAAAESLVHCHAGHLTDPECRSFHNSSERNRVWLSGAWSSLEKLQSQQTPFVGLYLSFVLAMLNEGIAAENAYHLSLLSTAWTGHPGELSRMLTGNDIRPHPWWVFGEWIADRTAALGKVITEPLRVLPLVWRRGLQHPSYSFHRNPYGVVHKQVADIQGLTLDLRVTPKGHLTGAMVQNLPPMTKVCFDAFNGQVHLGDSCCEELHRWDNYGEAGQIREQFLLDCNGSLPLPNMIYADPQTSTTVSVVITSVSKHYESEACSRSQQTLEDVKFIKRESRPAISVIYRSRGTNVVINVTDAVLQDRKRQTLEAFSSQCGEDGKVDPARMTDAKGFIDFCLNRSYDCTLDLLQQFMKSQAHGSASRPAPQPTPATNREFAKFVSGHKINSHWFKTVEMRLKNVLHVGKATVVLLLDLHKYDVLLFLDCSSAASVRRPVLRRSQDKHAPHWNRSQRPAGWVVPGERHCWNAQKPSACLLFAFTGTQDEREQSLTHFKMQVFDEGGDAISFKKFKNRSPQDVSQVRYFTSCEGQKLIGTNRTKTKVTVCDFETQKEQWSAEFARIEKLTVAQSSVFVSTTEGVFALAINSLEPRLIVQLNPSKFVAPSNDNGLLLNLQATSANYLKVWDTRDEMARIDRGEHCSATFIGMENHVLVVSHRKTEEGKQPPNVLEVMDVMIPGKPMELCYLSQKAGFVVSATIFSDEGQAYYRENLYWFDMAGDVVAIHPFVGRGPHGFLPVYLPDPNSEVKADHVNDILYLYFADGLGALCCIKLDIFEYR